MHLKLSCAFIKLRGGGEGMTSKVPRKCLSLTSLRIPDIFKIKNFLGTFDVIPKHITPPSPVPTPLITKFLFYAQHCSFAVFCIEQVRPTFL